jgi:hypothetical protein
MASCTLSLYTILSLKFGYGNTHSSTELTHTHVPNMLVQQ